MRIIQLTGGFSYELRADLNDRDGSDLTLLTIKAALVPEETEPPISGDAAWKTPTVQILGTGLARVKLTINETMYGPGEYWFWGLIGSTPLRATNEKIEIR